MHAYLAYLECITIFMGSEFCYCLAKSCTITIAKPLQTRGFGLGKQVFAIVRNGMYQ